MIVDISMVILTKLEATHVYTTIASSYTYGIVYT